MSFLATNISMHFKKCGINILEPGKSTSNRQTQLTKILLKSWRLICCDKKKPNNNTIKFKIGHNVLVLTSFVCDKANFKDR